MNLHDEVKQLLRTQDKQIIEQTKKDEVFFKNIQNKNWKNPRIKAEISDILVDLEEIRNETSRIVR